MRVATYTRISTDEDHQPPSKPRPTASAPTRRARTAGTSPGASAPGFRRLDRTGWLETRPG
jgi:hypothetical protein